MRSEDVENETAQTFFSGIFWSVTTICSTVIRVCLWKQTRTLKVHRGLTRNTIKWVLYMNQLNISRYSPLVLVGDTSLLRPFSDSFPLGIVGNTRNNHRLCHRHRPTGWPTYSGSHRSISPGKWPASVLWLLSLLYTAAFLAWLEQLQDALFIHDDLWQAEGSKKMQQLIIGGHWCF